MKSKKTLTTLTITFAVLGGILSAIGTSADIDALEIISAGCFILGLISFIGLIISLVIGSTKGE